MSDIRIYLLRVESEDNQTIGVMHIYNRTTEIYSCYTLELPWVNNQRNISCIQKGEYDIVRHDSPKFGDCLHIKDVPSRSKILVHKGNFKSDTKGCVLVGNTITDIDGDGSRDVTSSSDTMDDLLGILTDKGKIIIS